MRELSIMEIENVIGGEVQVTSTLNLGIYQHSVSGTHQEVRDYWMGALFSLTPPGMAYYVITAGTGGGGTSGWW